MSKKLQHFDVDQSKMQGIVQFVVSLIKRDFSDLKKIPQHSRWRHFDVGGRPRIQTLVNAWTSLGTDKTEQTRRILDLFVVALLLDITPATTFIYHEPSTNRALKNNQGIAVAILDMFMNGSFSSSPNQPHRVDGNVWLMSLSLLCSKPFFFFFFS
jgi:hypothetical protein